MLLNNPDRIESQSDEFASGFQSKKDEKNVCRPIEMKTYVQLEMDWHNNCACIPRICKFCITKLTLRCESSSVILAIKLDVSRRSLRTVDIPISKSNFSIINEDKVAELNLHYSVTYPHFLKKDTNFLYFYLQKRKKLKNRTILGYKTIGFAYVDLSRILQKTISNDLIIYATNSNATNSTKEIIGSIKLNSLTSLPIENSLDNLKTEIEDIEEEKTEDDDTKKLSSKNISYPVPENFITERLGCISENEIENEHRKKENSKNFTGKILSFIRKLRNENRFETYDEITDDINEDYEIDQVSDISGSEADLDVYSIVSTPKPKLQPFFTGSNPDLSL